MSLAFTAGHGEALVKAAWPPGITWLTGRFHVDIAFSYWPSDGPSRFAQLPLSLRLIREIHAELLRGTRGGERTPGEFRRSQNWIGPERCTLAEARYVPPPPEEALAALGDLERFLHDGGPLPILVRAALVHAHFETIHPFLDGNGRMGRLLITFLLCAKGVLHRPMLYLSYDFKRRQQEYHDRLQAVRDTGDVEGWVWFFLEGVRDVAREGTESARRILRLREEHRNLVTSKLGNSTTGIQLLDSLFERPVVTVQLVQAGVHCIGLSGGVRQKPHSRRPARGCRTGRGASCCYLQRPAAGRFGQPPARGARDA